MRCKRLNFADGLDLVEPFRRGAWNELVQKGVPHIGSNAGDDPIDLPFLRGLLSRGLCRVARPLGGVMEVSEKALRLFVPFARCPKRDAGQAQGYRSGRLEHVMERAGVVSFALGLCYGAIFHISGKKKPAFFFCAPDFSRRGITSAA